MHLNTFGFLSYVLPNIIYFFYIFPEKFKHAISYKGLFPKVQHSHAHVTFPQASVLKKITVMGI